MTTTPSLAADHIDLRPRPAGVRAGRSALRLALSVVVLLGVAACSAGDTDGVDVQTTVDVDGGIDVDVETTLAVDADAMPSDGLDVQGHRGARGLRPENTLPAFEIALDLGVTTLELDLHFSADDQVVVWHDPVVDPAKCRLSLDAGPDVPDPDEASEQALAIRNLTVAQLSQYSCDRNPDSGRFPDQVAASTDIAGTDFRIVTLSEVFSFVESYASSDLKTDEQRSAAGRVEFNVETKRVRGDPRTIDDGFDGTNPGPFELALLAAIEGARLEDRVIIQSFDHRSLRAIRLVDAGIRLAALTSDPARDPAQYADWGAAIWSPRASTLDEELLTRAQDAGLLVIPWTVNDPDDMQALIDLGVDGLITDRPDLLLGGT